MSGLSRALLFSAAALLFVVALLVAVLVIRGPGGSRAGERGRYSTAVQECTVVNGSLKAKGTVTNDSNEFLIVNVTVHVFDREGRETQVADGQVSKLPKPGEVSTWTAEAPSSGPVDSVTCRADSFAYSI